MSQTTTGPMHRAGMSGRTDRNPVIMALLLPSVLYNCVLAVINNMVMPLGFAHIALAEMLILVLCMIYLLTKGIFRQHLPVLAFLGFNVMVAGYMMVVNAALFIEYLRSIMIISIFTMIGTWANRATVVAIFRIACIAVLAVLLVEIFRTTIYENVFNPASYFENTRGLRQISFDGSKLFQNAQKIPGRFSFGLADHRTSSIFLEQVSLANFSGVLIIYLMAMYTRIARSDRILLMVTIAAIITTNDSRTMLIFSGVCFLGYFIFPSLSTKLTALIMPGILAAGLLVYLVFPSASGDTINGRIVLTINKLAEIDFNALMGLNVAVIGELADSGYAYVVNAGTAFGLLALWLFVSFLPAGRTAAQRRAAYSLSIFFFMNMMIGGNAVFSIKIAALLWLLVGYMKVSELDDVRECVPSRNSYAAALAG
ncbi:hypothetical protein [Hoeflea marina]|nr:hypothetical protein [Hoeflea marina]